MKKSEIKVNGLYKAKVANKVVTVKVLEIIDRDAIRNPTTNRIYRKGGTSYRVLNAITNRETTFRSASRFRSTATEIPRPVVSENSEPEQPQALERRISLAYWPRPVMNESADREAGNSYVDTLSLGELREFFERVNCGPTYCLVKDHVQETLETLLAAIA